MNEVIQTVEGNLESESRYFQRALDLEAMGLMGITPDEKYRQEVAVVFGVEQGGFSSLPQNAQILDLACGRGDTSKLMQEGGFMVTGVDDSAEAVQEAEQRFKRPGLNFQKGDMKHPPHTEEGYDAITCFGRSLAYFQKYPEYIEALKNWNDALKPGGKVAIEWTEWDSSAVEGGTWHSIGGTTVKTQPELKITDQNSGEQLSIMKPHTEYLDVPEGMHDHPVEKHYGGRLYIDASGKQHELGTSDSLFVDLLRKRHFPLLQKMMGEAGFINVRLVEAPKPLTKEGNIKTCRVFAITAEKPSAGAAISGTRKSIDHVLKE